MEALKSQPTDLVELVDKINTYTDGWPQFELGEFENWVGLQTIEHLLLVYPENEQQIQKVVDVARHFNLKVRCAGTGHSWSELFPDERNILLRTEKMHGVKLIWDEEGKQVQRIRVQCGATLGQVAELEKEYGFNLACNVIIPFPTYGGLVAAACHGGGWDCKSVSDYVTWMSIVDANGELREYSKEKDVEMMRAVQCSLGMFGVISEIELQVLPKKMARAIDIFDMTVGQLFYNKAYLKELVTSYDGAEVSWCPFQSAKKFQPKEWRAKNDKTWVRLVNVDTFLDKPASQPDDTPQPKGRLPTLGKWGYNSMKWSHQPDPIPLVDAIHYLHPVVEQVPVRDMEWAFNVTDDFSTTTTACQKVIELVEKYAKQSRYPMDMMMEMRWIGHSEVYLCPAIVGKTEPPYNGSGHTIFLEVLAGKNVNPDDWKEFCNDVYKEWTSIEGTTKPRFHWAKEWGLIDGIDDYAREICADEIAAFKNQLEASGADPDGMFTNKQLEGIFYPTGRPCAKK